MIYHYTTIKAFNDILVNYRETEDKDHFVFWASSAYAMNDSTEMQYGWEVLKNNFQAYEIENDIPEDKRLSFYMDKIENSEMSKAFYQHFYREELTPFFLSFSENRDDLTMWSMYGGAGEGLCLCFEEDKLEIYDDSLRTILRLNALYVNQDDNDKLSAMALGTIIPEQYTAYLDKDNGDVYDKIVAIGSSLPLISVYVKDSSFKFEKEIRIPFLAKDIRQSICFRTSPKGSIIPFVKIPIPKASLKEIIIGPCLQSQQIERGLKLILSVCGLEIDVSSSEIPYRNY